MREEGTMDERRLLSSLMALRSEWTANSRAPYYQDRGEWVRGVIKGIDLSIARFGNTAPPPPKSGGSWFIVLLAFAIGAGVGCWLTLSMR